MMKYEFDNMVGITTDPACYEKIEYVYMNSDFFDDVNGKQQIADFYKKHDMDGIERLYKEDKKMKMNEVKSRTWTKMAKKYRQRQ